MLPLDAMLSARRCPEGSDGQPGGHAHHQPARGHTKGLLRTSSPTLRRGAISSLRVLLFALLILSADALSIPSASAQNLIDPRQRQEARESGAGMSLDRAVRLAESRYGAKAVKATTVSNGDRLVHQIRLIRDGRVFTVNVDAQTGDIY